MHLPSASSRLETRQFNNGFNEGPYYNDNWYNWGRWVVLVGVVLFFLVLFFFCSCFTARRKRKQGNQPYYGTGWLAPQHGPVNYYGNQRPQQEPAQYYGNEQYGNTNQGYYSGQTNGAATAPPYNASNGGYYNQQENSYELQSPPNTYQPQTGGTNVYEPPMGPPPSKKGDVIR